MYILLHEVCIRKMFLCGVRCGVHEEKPRGPAWRPGTGSMNISTSYWHPKGKVHEVAISTRHSTASVICM